MKLYRVLALVLAILMIGCVMVACDEKEPEAVKTNVNVKFTIKAGTDKDSEILAQDAEYVYTYDKVGDKEPTVTEVLIDVCEFYELTIAFQDDSQQVVTKIGSKTPGKGEFWTYALNGQKSLIRDGGTTPCNSTTCTQFTRIRQKL